jgi:hypothetical protein
MGVSALIPDQDIAYLIVGVFDGMNYQQLDEADLQLYDESMSYIGDFKHIAGEYGKYVYPGPLVEGDVFRIWIQSVGYYSEIYEVTLPHELLGPTFETSYPLFKRAENVSVSVPEVYDEVSGYITTSVRIVVNDENVVFGARGTIDIWRDDVVEGSAVIFKATSIMMIDDFDAAWQTAQGFYYLYEIGSIFNDADNPSDGELIAGIGFELYEDVNLSIIVVEGFVQEELTFTNYDTPVSLIYENGTLSYTQEYTVLYYDNFSAPRTLDDVDLDDLVVITSTTPEPTTPKEYTSEEWLLIVGAALFLVSIFIVMIFQSSRVTGSALRR